MVGSRDLTDSRPLLPVARFSYELAIEADTSTPRRDGRPVAALCGWPAELYDHAGEIALDALSHPDSVVVDGGDVDILELIADAVRDQQCILFLGAGIHAPPPDGSSFEYPTGLRPPVGSGLSQELARRCAFGDRFPDEDAENLQRVALFYEIKRSRHQLVDAVRNAVQVDKEPSPMLRGLAELAFPLVITTNYDQLFEKALAAAGKHPRVAAYTPNLERTTDYRDPTSQSPIVFKIHGDISRPETIVVTDEDYIQFVLRMSSKEPYDPLPLTLKFHLTGGPTLFLGYSLLDYNLRLLFQTILSKLDSANVPDMYAVDYHPDPLIFDVWDNQRRYVHFIAQDVWAFVPRLYELVLGKELHP